MLQPRTPVNTDEMHTGSLPARGIQGSNTVGEEDRVCSPRERSYSPHGVRLACFTEQWESGRGGKGCSQGCLEGYGVPTEMRTFMSASSECLGCFALILGGQEWELGER